MAASDSTLAPFERLSPTLFLLAAVVFVVTGLLLFVRVTTDTTLSQILGLVGTMAFVLGFAGLLGLYPTAVSWNRKVGYGVGIFGVVGLVGMIVVDITFLVRILGTDLPAAVDALNLTRYVGLVGFVLAGALAVRQSEHTVLGLHLLAVAVIEYVAIAVIVAGAPEWTILVFVAANVIVYGSIGYRLRSDEHPTRAENRNIDSPS